MQKSFSPNSADASASLFSFLSAWPFTHLVINPADHSTTHANDRSLDLILMYSPSSIALRAVLIRPCALQTTISILPLLCDPPSGLFIGTVSPDRLASTYLCVSAIAGVLCRLLPIISSMSAAILDVIDGSPLQGHFTSCACTPSFVFMSTSTMVGLTVYSCGRSFY